MIDYYELLGVPVNADKDTIRTAYRNRLEDAGQDERAELNKAWNVLSDPMQRGRYDAELHEPVDETADADDEVEVVDAPSGRNGATGARQAAGGRQRPEPTITVPGGFTLAEPRQRNRGTIGDISALALIAIVCVFVTQLLAKQIYPTETKQESSLSKEIKKADDAKSKADDAKSKADDQLKTAQTKSDDTAEAKAKDAQSKAEADAKAAQKKGDDLRDQYNAVDKKVRPFQSTFLLASVMLLGVGYAVFGSRRTGQTIAKKRAKVRLVSVDGSPANNRALVLHYGVPIALGALGMSGVFGALSFVALIAAFALVFVRDRNRQGLHDRLAKTIVVEA